MLLHRNSPCGTRKVPASRDNSEETNAVSGRVKSGFPGAAAVVKQECDKVFRSEYMSTHMLSHSTGKLFHCETCGARFIYEANLRRHLQHSNPDGFSSDICKKSFLCKDYLKAHMNTHLSGGHFECELCQKVYTKKDSLRSHLRRHKIQSVSGAAAAATKQWVYKTLEDEGFYIGSVECVYSQQRQPWRMPASEGFNVKMRG